MVICCIPHSAIITIVIVGVVLGSIAGVSAIEFAGGRTMEIAVLLVLMMGIACPVMMGLMMWMMMRSNHSGTDHPRNTAEHLARLRKQRQQLDAEIADLEIQPKS
jgi:hypothetical protein